MEFEIVEVRRSFFFCWDVIYVPVEKDGAKDPGKREQVTVWVLSEEAIEKAITSMEKGGILIKKWKAEAEKAEAMGQAFVGKRVKVTV